MPAISAFVGHSFRKEDEEVVNAILQCLSRVRDLRSDFSWDNAREPQPTSIDAKVAALFKGKNLFIAICTRAERAVPHERVSRLASWCFVQESAFRWKASDWVLQEIGYALGREMNIILLVENGIREPGELQGNLERIPFDRLAPEKCFDPLLGMLGKLAGKASSTSPIADQASPAGPFESHDERSSIGDLFGEPDADWDLFIYYHAFLCAANEKDVATQEKLKDEFARSTLAESDHNRVAWKAYVELAFLKSGAGGTIASLEEMYAKSTPKNAEVAYCVAMAYEHFDDSGTSSTWYERASEFESNSSTKVFYLREAVLASLKARTGSSRVAELEFRMRGIALVDQAAASPFLRAEIAIAEERKDDEYAIASMERFLALNVSDEDMRFKLAYKYGDLNQYEMATYHYEKIPHPVRKGSAWNNLGVAYSNLNLPIKAIAAYRKAVELGETIAMANTAQRFLGAGFLPEGKELLEKASAISDHDRLVDSHFADAKTLTSGEEEKERELLVTAKTTSDFYERFGAGLAACLKCNVDGEWRSRKGRVVIKVVGDNLTATCTEPENALGLGFIFGLTTGGGTSTEGTAATRQIEYSGRVRGRTVLGTMTDKYASRSAERSLLGDYPETTVMMWVSEDCTAINLLVRSAGGKAKFLNWSRAKTE